MKKKQIKNFYHYRSSSRLLHLVSTSCYVTKKFICSKSITVFILDKT